MLVRPSILHAVVESSHVLLFVSRLLLAVVLVPFVAAVFVVLVPFPVVVDEIVVAAAALAETFVPSVAPVEIVLLAPFAPSVAVAVVRLVGVDEEA